MEYAQNENKWDVHEEENYSNNFVFRALLWDQNVCRIFAEKGLLDEPP